MKRILVTGSNGQLGSEIKELSKNNIFAEFIFTDKDDLDITNLEKLESFFEEKKIDYVINCAAYTAVDKAEQEPEKAFLINAKAIEYLTKVCKKHQSKLIHISTDYVFNGETYLPYKEDNLTNPQSVYGKSKLKAEEIILNSNIDAIILRTSWLYSFYGYNFVKTIRKLILKHKKLNVIFDQVGTPTYAYDLAKIILEIIFKTFQNKENFKTGIYNFSNEGVCSWYDFAIEISNFLQREANILPIETKDFPTLAKRPHYSVLNKTKIKQAFDIKIPYWKDSLLLCLTKLEN